MDNISNMLSTIRNTGMSGRKSVEVPYSKIKEEVLKVMKEKEFIDGVHVFKPSGSPYKMLVIDLKYEGGTPRISKIMRISKPGRRVYSSGKSLKKIMGGFGMEVVSTSQGIMDSSTAKKKKLGGEVICRIF